MSQMQYLHTKPLPVHCQSVIRRVFMLLVGLPFVKKLLVFSNVDKQILMTTSLCIYSGTPLIQTPIGCKKVSMLW